MNKLNKNYFRVHSWLIYWNGRANHCSNKDCTFENPKRFEWALKKNKKYKKNVSNFIQLCCSCHRKYDLTDEIRQKISKSKKGKPAQNKRAVSLNGVECFESITSASLKKGISITSINNNLRGLSKTTKLGKWEYKVKN
tara:strand:+ start:74 stop:490 length:417 start_codon:yes stop_codon:yes gene_type:complete